MATVKTSRRRDLSVLAWACILSNVVAAEDMLSSWNKGR